jgi:uroporphyrin-III C-methyltransferase
MTSRIPGMNGEDAAKPGMDVAIGAGGLAAPARRLHMVLLLTLTLAAVALLASVLLWQKLSNIQEQLARQSADAQIQAADARLQARQAADLARETAARVAVTDARLAEVALQRGQLEELMQSLSRSRDENLVVDIESAVRLAQQQAQLTGSLEPLVATLKAADQRIARAAQPRLNPVVRAIAKDLSRIQTTAVGDTPALLVRIDELVRMADDLPLSNAVGPASTALLREAGAMASTPQTWWQRALTTLRSETRALLRVSRIEQPEAALLSPEQAFFVRENLKLRLLNARMGLLARQLESARADVSQASASLNKYFDPSARKTQTAATLMQSVQAQMKVLDLPRVDDTLAALTTAAAGR